MKEIWMPVPDTIYYASNLGRIKSKNRVSVFYSDHCNKNINRKVKGALRKQHLNKKCNYWEISVAHHDRKRRTPIMKKVHRMVAAAFLPNPSQLPQVNHKDGNRLNNHVSNLEWCTAQENLNHASDTGLLPCSIHTSIVDKVIEDHQTNNLSYSEIAKKYSISTTSVWRIVNGIYPRYKNRLLINKKQS